MDEMRMIGTLLDERPSECSVAEGRARLEREIESGRRTRRFSIPRWSITAPVLAAGSVAAVTAVAVAMSSGTTPRAPDHQAAQPVSARSVLLSAATRIEQAPATHGRYWSVVTQERMNMGVGDRAFETINETGLWDEGPGKHAWIAERRVRSKDLGPAPKDGPKSFDRNGRPATTPPGDRGPTPWTKVKVKGGEAFRLADWEGVPAINVRELPDTPDALRRFFDQKLRQAQARTGGPIDSVEWLFSNAQKLGSAPVSPKVLGALYRVLATDPKLRVAGTVTDPLGRKGTAIAHRVTAESGHVHDEQLVLDPATGRLLAERDVLVQPGKAWLRGGKPGDVTYYTAVISRGWTDTVPRYKLGKVG
ncbi:CU044_5270 family protein [Actinomadura barringtoniae]|uniref:CU044_5270 family protein n=1 Tax=Actinomadura barringtoniae TaxID=1427535 RepID=A0A939PG78_9ACTN|nr:CU044_5270 family protein [Actinomadura barringtoniae]MBO2449174.1 CU044_5270 family protein [Actinomadura barringtoniae]